MNLQSNRLSRIFLGGVIFITAIGSGMQLARGQEGLIPGFQPNPFASPTPAPSAIPAPNSAQAENLNKMQQQMQQQQQQMQQMMQQQQQQQAQRQQRQNQQQNAKPAEPKPFQPSEVVAILPKILQSGEPRAIVKTSMGDFTVKLSSTFAPNSVRHFIELARGDREFVDVKTSKKTRRPFYDGLVFHKVIAGSFIQGGCPFGTGKGDPGFTVPDEFSERLTFDKPGMIAFAPARNGLAFVENSNGSQFFITLTPMPAWNGKFTVFGEVEKGMSTLEKIARAKVGPTDRPIRRIYIRSIEIIDEVSAKANETVKAAPLAPAASPTPSLNSSETLAPAVPGSETETAPSAEPVESAPVDDPPPTSPF